MNVQPLLALKDKLEVRSEWREASVRIVVNGTIVQGVIERLESATRDLLPQIYARALLKAAEEDEIALNAAKKIIDEARAAAGLTENREAVAVGTVALAVAEAAR
ncbi:MAG TPA: hypothetical protein VGP72_14615 [Planctomycetota bacterium]